MCVFTQRVINSSQTLENKGCLFITFTNFCWRNLHTKAPADSRRLHKLYEETQLKSLRTYTTCHLKENLFKQQKGGGRKEKQIQHREVSRHPRPAVAPVLLISEAQWQQSRAEKQPHGTWLSRKSLDPYIVWSSRIILSTDKTMLCAWLQIHKYRASAHMLFPFSAFPLICKSCNLSLELTEPTSKPAVL